MKKFLLISAIILLVVGIGFLLFAPISNAIGTRIAQDTVVRYDERLERVVTDKTREQAIDDGDIPADDRTTLFVPDLERLYRDSAAYNERIRKDQANLLVGSDAYEAPALHLEDYGIFDGVYAYVSIPKIDMLLPIYLGADGESMSYGAAHMTYTSLPLGGARSNCVLAGHSGYVGRVFFDNLFDLIEGDSVIVRNFWGTLEYRVISTEVHEPGDSQNVFINDDRDLLTLFTCTSNGKGGFNRYHVICERVNVHTPADTDRTG